MQTEVTHSNPLTPRHVLKVIAVLILFLGIGLRTVNLGARPLHHDESIHATFSAQWAESPDRSFYKYDPTYHGPFLYCITRWIFPLFGLGSAEARIFPLFFGILSLFSSLLFFRWLGRTGTALAFSLLALSPLMVYYSRFLAHDMPSLCFASLMAYGLLRFYEGVADKNFHIAKRSLLIGVVALGLLFSVKTVALLYAFIFITFFIFDFAYRRSHRLPNFWPTEWQSPRVWGLSLLLAALSFCVAYGFFQTSYFRNPGAFFDGLIGKNLSYWWNQHKIERLTGPVTYHLRSLLLHELPLCLILAIGLRRITRRNRFGKAALISLGVLFILTVLSPWTLERGLPQVLLIFFAAVKMKSSADIFLYALCFVFGIVGTYQLRKEGRFVDAFLNYWTFASLAIYSYAGEKAPWLTLHVAFPAILLAAKLVAPRFAEIAEALNTGWKLPNAKRALAASFLFLLVYQARLAYFVSHVTAGRPADLLSQVHNHEDVNRVLDWMKREAFEAGEKNEELSIAIAGNITWAFYFHFLENGFKKFTLEARQITGKERFILTDEDNAKVVSDRLVREGYQKIQYIHAGWWVPEHGIVSWGDWVRYALTRKVASGTGTSKLFVFHRPFPPPATTPAPPVPMRATANSPATK